MNLSTYISSATAPYLNSIGERAFATVAGNALTSSLIYVFGLGGIAMIVIGILIIIGGQSAVRFISAGFIIIGILLILPTLLSLVGL